MISIIDRYIIKLFTAYFLGGLLVFVTLFLAVDFMSAMARYDVTFSVLVEYYKYFIPGIIYQMIPVGCLVATVFTLSHLNKNNELTALFTLGFSLARISVPILGMIAIISTITFWAGDQLLPTFAQKKNYVYYVEINKTPGLYSMVKTNRIWYRSGNTLFNIRSLDTEKKMAEGLTMYYFDDNWHLVQLIQSDKVLFKKPYWQLRSGVVNLLTEDSSFPLTKKFKRKTIQMGQDVADIDTTVVDSEVMSIKTLKKFIKKNKEMGIETIRYEVDYQGKFGFAFAAFVMSFIGIPFSVQRQRAGGTFLQIGICVGLAFGYWILYSSFLTMGRNALLPPIVAAWGANVLMMGVSIQQLLKLKR